MEASETPQLPLDDGHDGTVRALEDRLVIERLTIVDERAAHLVRDRQEQGQDPARTVADAIEVGARVLDREEATVEVDFVRREYERAVSEHRRESERQQREAVERIEAEVRRAFGDGDARGLLAEALDAHQREIEGVVEETFGEDAVPRKIQELIESRNRDFLDRLSADDELNPLRPLLGQFSKWARERREAQDERDDKIEEKLDELLAKAAELAGFDTARGAIDEAEQAGTRKGRSFEERVHGALERIAEARGDCAHHVGDARGDGGSKKGDTVVEVGAADGRAMARIVFEDKDDQLSKNKAWEELNAAMAERDADFGVLVVAGEGSIPAGREQLVDYEGNKMIVAVDPEMPDELGLDLAYRYARLRVLAARDRSLEVDAAGVRDAAEAARSALKRAQSVRLALTSIDKSSAKAREGVEGIVAEVEVELTRIESLVAAAAPDDAQG